MSAANAISEPKPGGFADFTVTAAGLPPDDAPKGPLYTPAPVAKTEPTPAPVEPPEPPKVVKTEPEERVNPHLTLKKEEPAGDDDTVPQGMTKKAEEGWKKIKADAKALKVERDAAKKEADDIKAQLAEHGTTKAERDALKKELEAVKAEIKGYEEEISVTRVESTRTFKTEVNEPMNAITAALKEMAARYEIPEESLMKAISETDRAKRTDAIEDVTVDFKGADKFEVVEAARDWQRLQVKADSLRKDSAAKLEEITRQQKDQDDRVTQKTVSDYRGSVSEQWEAVQNMIPELRKVDGATEWNAHVDSLRKQIEDIDVTDLPVTDVAKMAAHYKAMPEVLAVMKHFKGESEKQKARADAAEAKLAAYVKTAPGAGGGNNGSTGGKKTTAASSGFFTDSVFAEG